MIDFKNKQFVFNSYWYSASTSGGTTTHRANIRNVYGVFDTITDVKINGNYSTSNTSYGIRIYQVLD